MKTTTKTFTALSMIALSLGAAVERASAQEAMFGKAAFMDNCAVCHGPEGAGDGPVAELFAQRPRNLQHLAKDNNGAYPFSEVYQAISGTRTVGGHGYSEMPIWGNLFMEDALPKTIHPGVDAEEIVQGRILALVYYLQTIQK